MTTRYTRFPSPLCDIILVGDERGLQTIHLDMGDSGRDFQPSQDWERDDDFFTEPRTQILEYLHGERTVFDLALNPAGTDFRRSVWDILCTIPYGEVRTYGDIARQLGNPGLSRAVGAANGANPLPLVVPCHRVIGAGGKLTGFAFGLSAKEWLLRLETNGQRTDTGC